MTDTIEILLTVVVTTLTVLLAIIGVQIILILTEVRNILKKTDSMMGDAERITHSVVEPVEEASSFVMGIKSGFGVMRNIRKIFAAEEIEE